MEESSTIPIRTEPAGCCVPRLERRERDRSAREAVTFAALGEEARLNILRMLARERALCVCEFQAALDLGQPTVSHHLRVLREAGLVDCERRGRWAYYFLNRPAIKALAGGLLELL